MRSKSDVYGWCWLGLYVTIAVFFIACISGCTRESIRDMSVCDSQIFKQMDQHDEPIIASQHGVVLPRPK